MKTGKREGGAGGGGEGGGGEGGGRGGGRAGGRGDDSAETFVFFLFKKKKDVYSVSISL